MQAVIKTFEHAGRTFRIMQDPKYHRAHDVLDDQDNPVMIVSGKIAYVPEGRYGNFEFFGGQYEFFMVPISTRIETATGDFVEAIEYMARYYLEVMDMLGVSKT